MASEQGLEFADDLLGCRFRNQVDQDDETAPPDLVPAFESFAICPHEATSGKIAQCRQCLGELALDREPLVPAQQRGLHREGLLPGGEIHDGEHEPILDEKTWESARAIMTRNVRERGASVRNKYGQTS